jgi:hypothetical protein
VKDTVKAFQENLTLKPMTIKLTILQANEQFTKLIEQVLLGEVVGWVDNKKPSITFLWKY